MQAAAKELDQVAAQLVALLPKLATVDPALTGNTLTAQVAAAKKGIEAALEAAKAMAER